MNKIKFFRELKKIRQVDLAFKLKVSQATLSNWERNIHDPDTESLILLSKILDVTVSDILGIHEANKEIIRIPVLGTIPAGVPLEAIEDILDFEEVPASWGSGGKEYFALSLDGDSMSPKYMTGDVVIFQIANDCDSGQDCAVMVNGDESTFKKVVKQQSGVVLQPLNTSIYEPVFYSNKEVEELPVRIIGVAKEIRRKI